MLEGYGVGRQPLPTLPTIPNAGPEKGKSMAMTSMTTRGGRRRLLARTVLVAGATAAGLVLAGCSSGGSGSNASASGASEGAVNIAAFVADQSNPLDTAVAAALQDEAAKQGATITIFDGKNDPNGQANACQSAVGTGRYDALIIKPVSGPTMMPCARNALAAGDKVIALDTALGPEDVAAIQVPGISASIVSLAKTNGQGLVTLTQRACQGVDPCNVLYLYGPPSFKFVADTRQAFLDGIASDASVKIVADQTNNWDTNQAGSDAKQLLQAHPEVSVITMDCDQCAIAVQSALAASGQGAGVKIISAGSSGPGVDAIKAGKIFGSTVLLPRTIAKEAVDDAIKAVRGETIDQTELEAVSLSTVGPVVTQDNVDQFTAEW